MARATAGSDGCTATQSCVQPKMAWRSCRPASDVQPLPGSRLLQGHGSGSSARKYGQRVRCSTFPPMVARLRIWAEAACRQAEASAPASWLTSGCSPTSFSVASAPMRSSSPSLAMPRSSSRPPMSTTRSAAAMPSRNQLSSSVPPAITDVRGPASAPAAASAVPARA